MAPADPPRPKLYGDLAGWFHLLTAPSDYAEEADLYRRLLARGDRAVTSVLELGSGGGNNASHLKAHYEMVLVDPSEPMLAVSRGLNPECAHLLGDMRSVRLDRRFDAVFVHDAASYLTSLDDVAATARTAFVHLEAGGVALFAPDFLRETFTSGTRHGGHDDGERGLRYLEWTRDPEPASPTYVVDFVYLLREGDDVRAEHDRHHCGAFRRDDWLDALRDAGFREATTLSEPEFNDVILGIR